MNRMKPIEKQPSMAIFSVFDGLVFYCTFNIENLEQAALNIQIWIRLLLNIMIDKCYFLELATLSLRI